MGFVSVANVQSRMRANDMLRYDHNVVLDYHKHYIIILM